MTDIKSMTMEELTHTPAEMGQPAFRGSQVFTWLHRGVTSFEEMSDLPRAAGAAGADVPYHRPHRGPQAGVPSGRHHQNTCGSWRTATASRRC